MGLQAAVHLGHMPWALTKEEEEEERAFNTTDNWNLQQQSSKELKHRLLQSC
jgi:hypothetical protein